MSYTTTVNQKSLRNLSPSARIVFQILETEKQMRANEIDSQAPYSRRTVRYALRQLQNARLITQIPDMLDARRNFYAIIS